MRGTLWLLIYAAVFYLMMRYGCGAHMVHGGHGRHRSSDGAPSTHHGPATLTDPVCGMEVTPDSGYREMFHGREYRFCSRKCLDQFDAQPTEYTR